MDYNAFTGGVRPGSVTTGPEVMILICYLMDQAGQPVSFKELSAALQGQELVNYFQFAETMESLRRTGHILPQEYHGEQCFVLSEAGREVSRTFEAGLPPAVRERAAGALERILTLVRRQRENRVEIRQAEDGWIICMTMGMGMQDIIVANKLYKNAMEKGLGTKLTYWENPLWV